MEPLLTTVSILTNFANLPVLALPMEHHGGEDQKDLNQPYMRFECPDPGVRRTPYWPKGSRSQADARNEGYAAIGQVPVARAALTRELLEYP